MSLKAVKPASKFPHFLVKADRTYWWRWRRVWSRGSPQCWERAGGTKTAPFLPHRAGMREVCTAACQGTRQTTRVRPQRSWDVQSLELVNLWVNIDLSSSWFVSSSFRCWDSIFFSRARWIQARAWPTSDRPSLMVWMNLKEQVENKRWCFTVQTISFWTDRNIKAKNYRTEQNTGDIMELQYFKVKGTIHPEIINHTDRCFLSNIMEVDSAKAKDLFKELNSNASSRKHELDTQDNRLTLLWSVSCRNHFLSISTHWRKRASTLWRANHAPFRHILQ